MRNEHGVHCQPFKTGERRGHPYAKRKYRSVAEEFAAGRKIENWNDGGWFTIEGTHYQVVADSNCIDVIERVLPDFETPAWAQQDVLELEPQLIGSK